MTATFENAKQAIVNAEGGEVNSFSDLGGFTKFGISQHEFPDVNFTTLTEEKALMMVESLYWNPYRLDEIKDQTIANQMILLWINMNPIHAGKIIQAAVNGCGAGVLSVKADGVLGTETICAINTLPPRWLSDRIRMESCRYYLALTDEDHLQIPNFRGWIRRVLR